MTELNWIAALIAWGITGYCPDPGITALILGIPNPVLFVIAFILGSLSYQWYAHKLNKSDLEEICFADRKNKTQVQH